MHKQTYLNHLNDLLNQYVIDDVTKEDILKDYESLWDQYAALKISEEDIIQKLGHPEDIIEALTEGYSKKSTMKHHKQSSKNRKIIALSPFFSIIAFFMIGFLIPNGFMFAWIAFLSIPMSAIILEGPKHKIQKLTALSPFIALIIFFPILGFWLNLWHPGWLIFLIIPMIGGLNESNPLKRYVISGGILTTIIIYLITDQILSLGTLSITDSIEIPYSLFSFLPIALVLLFVQIKALLKNGVQYFILLMISITLYIVISVTYDLWVISWLIFFIIPLYAIYKNTTRDQKLIAMMPFISTILFMLLGYFFNAWAFAWMVYLLIPMTAIIKKA